MRYVIIGNSAAGVWAAETLRHLDHSSEVIMVAEESLPAYSRCLLPDYLAGDKDEDSLRIRPLDFYEKNNIETIFGQRADGVDSQNKDVILQDGRRISYDRLLIATGASSFIPPVPGLSGKNVFGLRNMSDVHGILEACKEARNIVVMGGGFVGLEAAYGLHQRGYEVTVVEKLPQILPQQFDERAAKILQNDMQYGGIRVILGQGIKEVVNPGLLGNLMKKGRRVILENNQQLEADVIIVATGTRANTAIVSNTSMNINRGIVVNDFMETSIQDIYAAGDVAETKDTVTGEIGLTPIWPNASIQGRIAAYNMAGQKCQYGGLVGMQNSVEFRKVPAIAMGITKPNNDSYKELFQYSPERNQYKKLVIQDNRLVGMILVGDITQAGIYGGLIKGKDDISQYTNEIMSKNFNYAHIYR